MEDRSHELYKPIMWDLPAIQLKSVCLIKPFKLPNNGVEKLQISIHRQRITVQQAVEESEVCVLRIRHVVMNWASDFRPFITPLSHQLFISLRRSAYPCHLSSLSSRPSSSGSGHGTDSHSDYIEWSANCEQAEVVGSHTTYS